MEVTWQNLLVNTGYQFIYKVSQPGQVNLFYSSLDFIEGYYAFIKTQSPKQFMLNEKTRRHKGN